ADAADAAPAAPAADNPDWVALQDAAQAYVEAYNSGDQVATAALFTPAAEMVREDGTKITGRDEIEDFYEALFALNPETQVALEATSVRFLSPQLAVEDGSLHVTAAADGEPASFRYTTLHVRQEDGTWLIAQSLDRKVANLDAHEHLDGVDGLVGEWTGKTDAGVLKLSVAWDESGSFLLGTIRYTVAGVEPTSATMRIGWNSLQKKITSWTFDQHGGFSQCEWTDTDEAWILKAHGYTNMGEATSSTQILQPTGIDSFRWSISDKIIGDEIFPERTLNMVRQPPKPQISSK
ncbi:MAG: SgcJ/EcaC family oxidoreductase, partial [Lentisphaeria bacterium]|nr:SgcJ/EcaC family oxidoreductase [Lentisphaeria bacterium]